MANERHKFKQISDIRNNLLMNKLELNLKTWFDWALLSIGAWRNIAIPTETNWGDLSQLRLVEDPQFTDGTVWESAKKDWVWETDIDYDDGTTIQNPISPAVIEVDNVVTAPDHINYPLGRVVFSAPIDANAAVHAEYSYRWVQTYIADDCPWWNELQYRSFRVDDSHFTQLGNGNWAIGGQHRVQMPCIVIEAVPRATSRPFQLGDGSAWVEQDVLCHVLAENRKDRNNLVDILRGQFDSTIWLYDNDLVAAAEDFPLDNQGEILDSSKTYPALVDQTTGYRWAKCRFCRTEVSEVAAINSRLFEGTVRMTCEVALND